MMQLDPKAVYRLVDVQDHQGASRVHTRKLYQDRVGCLATNLHWDGPTLRMKFVLDGQGNFINRPLHTSIVQNVEQTEGRLSVRTRNSVYLMDLEPNGEEMLHSTPAAPPAEAFDGTAPRELVELYFAEEGDHLCKGIYWDAQGCAHLLTTMIHLGMLVDTCLVGECIDGCVERFFCRYYLTGYDEIRFYDTLYHQQDYSLPMLIHNVGSIPLIISFEWDGSSTTIPVGGKAVF